MPLISVIVPVYKVERYIRRCVDSILNQTFEDFELILIDDGSPDNSGMICDEYAVNDSRIQVIHQENRGLSAARNTGIDWVFGKSESKWITFVDSDDWVHPRYLEALLGTAIEKSADVVIGGYEVTSGNNPVVSDDLSPVVCPAEWFYVYNVINATVAWGKLYRTECFNALRYPEGKLHEDEYVTYKILFRYDEVYVIPDPLYAYYQNENGIILSKWTTRRLDSIPACEEQVDYFTEHGYLLAAKERFRSLIHQYIEGKNNVKLCDDLSEKEKKAWIRKLDRKKRKTMLKYHRFHWISIKDKGFYLQAYDSIIPPFKVIRNIGLVAKDIIARAGGNTR